MFCWGKLNYRLNPPTSQNIVTAILITCFIKGPRLKMLSFIYQSSLIFQAAQMIIFIYLCIWRFIRYARHPFWVSLQNWHHKKLKLNWCISLPNRFSHSVPVIRPPCSAPLQSQRSDSVWEQGNQIAYVRALQGALTQDSKSYKLLNYVSQRIYLAVENKRMGKFQLQLEL